MKCLIFNEDADYYFFLDFDDINKLQTHEIIKGYVYREYVGMYYRTLGKIFLILKVNETDFSYNIDKELTLHTIPEFHIDHFIHNPKGLGGYRYNLRGDKLNLYNIELSECELVRNFNDPEFNKTYEYIKSLKLKGLKGIPEQNY